MKKMILKSALIAITGLGLMAGSAMAIPISGEISFSNGVGDSVSTVDGAWALASMDVATGFVFNDTGDGYNTKVDLASGDFLTLAGNDAIFANFQFSPSTFVNPSAVWTVGNFSFSLSAVNIDFQNDNFIILAGSGTITDTTGVLDDTLADFHFSTQTGGTWSAHNAVPEPATMLLFGTGLAGLAAVSRKKSKQA